MKVIVTTGPSYEPIDDVRRLTNFSTGELGVLLANQLAREGHEVFCLRGVSATHPGGLEGCRHLPFTTNDDLLAQLTAFGRAHDIGAVFHVAALCDFKLRHVEDERGQNLQSPKIDSRIAGLTLHLEPARKIIGDLRALFPRAIITGWKYELAGSRADALAKAWRQIRENKIDACVLNGRAWGSGFALCTPPEAIHESDSKPALVQQLARWLVTTSAAQQRS